MPPATNTELATAPALDDAEAEAIVRRAIERYIAQRRARVEAFVDANFSLLGALGLHRLALGLDLLRVPASSAAEGAAGNQAYQRLPRPAPPAG